MTYRDQCLVAVTVLSMVIFMSAVASVGAAVNSDWGWALAGLGNIVIGSIALRWARKRLREAS